MADPKERTTLFAVEGDARELAARLVGLLDSAMDAIVSLDDKLRVVQFNRAAEKIFGWPRARMLGEPLDKLMPARFREAHGAHVRRFGSTGATSRRMGDGTVLYGQRADGEEFPMEASISQLDTQHGKLFTVILRDVTERVRAQAELSLFAAQAHDIREQEKARVARELHDDLAQSLTALKMDVGWTRDNLPPGLRKSAPQLLAKLESMQSTLDQAVAATRRIAADLRPLVLDDLGLLPAVEWLVTGFIQRTGVSCVLLADEGIELAEPYATALFRIVQEALANVAKHAQATRVEVRIDLTGDRVEIGVCDNGSGFDAQAPRKPGSLGIMGLRERAHLLRGSLAIESRPGQGACVKVSIPLRRQAARP
jgi:PAS domain S-box-containing protein